MRTMIAIVLFCSVPQAWGHGEFPNPLRIEFSASHPDVQWVLTDSQGVFANLKEGFRWLCEDAIAPNSGVRGLAITGPQGERWAVATTDGLYRSTDGGCGFERVSGPVGSHHAIGLWRHLDSARWVTATSTVGVYNDIFISDDQGETWRGLGLQSTSRFIDLKWARGDSRVLYAQTYDDFLISRDGGMSFDSRPVVVSGTPIPGRRRLDFAVSPQAAEVMLMTVDAGERTRIIQSEDAGQSWRDVMLIPHPRVRLAFDFNGRGALAVTHLGLAWRSDDAGRTWSMAPAMPEGLGCLTHGPDGRTLWGCTPIYMGGPWVLGRSADFGRTWTPVLSRFEDAAERWDCQANDRATACCRGICPGALMPQECGQPGQIELPASCDQSEPEHLSPIDAQPSVLDAAMGDGSADAGSPVQALDRGQFDGTRAADMAVRSDTGPVGGSSRAKSGCQHGPIEFDAGLGGLLTVLIFWAGGRRRRRG